MDDRLTIRVRAPFDKVVAWVTESLREHGFGVLATIDLQEMMRAELDQHIEQFIILAACNPNLALRTLSIDRRVGFLLPCNVVVRVEDAWVVVEATPPHLLVDATGLAQLGPVAGDAYRGLEEALRAVGDVARTLAAAAHTDDQRRAG